MKRDRVLGKMTAQEAFRRHLEQIQRSQQEHKHVKHP
jgi:hypothetical protein